MRGSGRAAATRFAAWWCARSRCCGPATRRCAWRRRSIGPSFCRYRVDDGGTILEARIVPPTSQNQPTIEGDLGEIVPPSLDLPHDELRARCEHAIRNHDPCISCATHFLTLQVERE